LERYSAPTGKNYIAIDISKENYILLLTKTSYHRPSVDNKIIWIML